MATGCICPSAGRQGLGQLDQTQELATVAVGVGAPRGSRQPHHVRVIETAGILTATQQLAKGGLDLDAILGELESRCIRLALEKYNNNVSKAAEALHINRTTLYSRVQKLGTYNHVS